MPLLLDSLLMFCGPRLAVFQVLGRDECGLYPHAERLADRRHDRRGVVGGSCSLPGPAVRVEGPGLPRQNQLTTALPREPGRGVPDLRHLLHVLRTTACNSGAVLEDIPNCQEANTQTTPAKYHGRCQQRS